jgi:hypothetical protein
MKTLIIHPEDRSTTFLDIVYTPIKNKTVITGGISKSELNKLIENHDRIMMMGHGCPTGLFSVGQFGNSNGLIIDSTTVPLLNEKKDNVFIWCNADRFVNYHKLKGFYSGMFISEVGEANYCSKDFPINSNEYIKLRTTTQEEVDESNYGFCNIIAKHINEDTNIIHENVTKEYGIIAENNPVALYNNFRLYKS